jgi:hypothetical protein
MLIFAFTLVIFVLFQLLMNSWAADFELPFFFSRIAAPSPQHINKCSENLIIKTWPTERGFEIVQEVNVFKDNTLNKPFNFMTSFIKRAPIRTVHPSTTFTVPVPQVSRLKSRSHNCSDREVRPHRDCLMICGPAAHHGGIWLCNSSLQADSTGFWRWCIALRITGFLDFVHRSVF